MILYIDAYGSLFSMGVKEDNLLFQPFDGKGFKAFSLGFRSAKYARPTASSRIFFGAGINGFAVEVYGDIVYNRDGQVVSAGGIKFEYGPSRMGRNKIIRADGVRMSQYWGDDPKPHNFYSVENFPYYYASLDYTCSDVDVDMKTGCMTRADGVYLEYLPYDEYGMRPKKIGGTEIKYRADGRIDCVNGRRFEYLPDGRVSRV